MAAALAMPSLRKRPPTLPPGLALRAGADRLIWVELIHHPGVVERWIRFGAHADEFVLDRRTRFLGFAPGAVFCFIRWAAGDYGTAVSRVAILRAVASGEATTTSPGVTPGAEVLLNLSAWHRVRQVLLAIDGIEALGLDPACVPPDHWRSAHHRLSVGLPASAYSLDRHTAWLARRDLLS